MTQPTGQRQYGDLDAFMEQERDYDSLLRNFREIHGYACPLALQYDIDRLRGGR